MAARRWNEVVQAYESELPTLEAAREEFESAVSFLIEMVADCMKVCVDGTRTEDCVELKFESFETESGFAQHSCYIDIYVRGVFCLELAAWIASTYNGPKNCLRLAVHCTEIAGLVSPIRLNDLVQEERAQAANLSSIPQNDPDVSTTERWLAVEAIDLSKELQSGAVQSEVARLLDLSMRFAGRLVEETETTARIYDAVCSSRAVTEQRVVTPCGGYLTPEKPEVGNWLLTSWDRTHYYQYNRETKPVIWISIDPILKKVLYVHAKDRSDRNLSEPFAKDMEIEKELRAGYPAGTLVGPDEWEAVKEDQIVSRCVEVFEKFERLTRST